LIWEFGEFGKSSQGNPPPPFPLSPFPQKMKGRTTPRRGEHIRRKSTRRRATPLLYSRAKAPPLLYDKNLPTDLEGLDDASLYNGNKENLPIEQLIATACYAWFPLPGAGSILPHLYIPFVAELFLRSILIVWLMVLLWAVLEIAVYWTIKRFSIPVRWPKQLAIDPETEQEYEYVDYDYLYFMTGLANPIAGTIGMLVSWYSIRLFDLVPFRDEYDWLLVLFFVLFLVIAVHQGKHTAWLALTLGVPVFILAIMAPVFGAYTRGFTKFAPYLFWLLSNIWFSAWFVRDPFARKGSRFFFSIDGTYGWNAFFSVTIFVLAISLWKVIDLST
jgi:hypothetical protein